MRDSAGITPDFAGMAATRKGDPGSKTVPLRYLRAAQAVATERDGRVIRYRLASDAIAALLPARTVLPEHGAVTEQR